MLDKMNKQLDEVNLNLSKIDIQRKKFIEEHEQDNPQQVAGNRTAYGSRQGKRV